MPLFSAADVTWMQTLAGVALTDSCDILYNSNTSGDNQGGKTAAIWSVQATVPCAVLDGGKSGVGAIEVFQQGQQQSKILKTVLVPAGTNVKDNNRLRINGVYYEVIDAAGPITYEVVRAIGVVRLGQGAS